MFVPHRRKFAGIVGNADGRIGNALPVHGAKRRNRTIRNRDMKPKGKHEWQITITGVL